MNGNIINIKDEIKQSINNSRLYSDSEKQFWEKSELFCITVSSTVPEKKEIIKEIKNTAINLKINFDIFLKILIIILLLYSN